MAHIGRQALPSRSKRLSLFGEALPDRLRSTSLALLVAPVAIGLAAVALILQQGLPLVGSGPLPQSPSKPDAIDDRVAGGGATASPGGSVDSSDRTRPAARRERGSRAASSPSAEADGLLVTDSTSVDRPAGSPAASAPGQDDAPQPATSSPNPVPTAAPPASVPTERSTTTSSSASEKEKKKEKAKGEPPTVSQAGNGNANGKAKGRGSEKKSSPPPAAAPSAPPPSSPPPDSSKPTATPDPPGHAKEEGDGAKSK